MVPLTVFAALDDFDKIPLGIAIVGGALGFLLGTRFLHLERSAPAVCAVATGAIFFLAAYVLLKIAVLAIAILSLHLLITRVWPTIHEATVTLAHEAGVRLRHPRVPNFADRIADLNEKHGQRLRIIRDSDLPSETKEQLTETAETQYTQKMKKVTGEDY